MGVRVEAGRKMEREGGRSGRMGQGVRVDIVRRRGLGMVTGRGAAMERGRGVEVVRGRGVEMVRGRGVEMLRG